MIAARLERIDGGEVLPIVGMTPDLLAEFVTLGDACGFHRVTEKNVPEVYARIAVYRRLFPSRVTGDWLPVDVLQLVGLRISGAAQISQLAFSRRVGYEAIEYQTDVFYGYVEGDQHRASVA